MSYEAVAFVLRGGPDDSSLLADYVKTKQCGRSKVLTVLFCLAEYADQWGRNAKPSRTTIARETGLAERDVSNALALLEEHGVIVRTGNAVARSHGVVFTIPGVDGDATPSGMPDGNAQSQASSIEPTPSGYPSGTPSGTPSGYPSGTPSGMPDTNQNQTRIQDPEEPPYPPTDVRRFVDDDAVNSIAEQVADDYPVGERLHAALDGTDGSYEALRQVVCRVLDVVGANTFDRRWPKPPTPALPTSTTIDEPIVVDVVDLADHDSTFPTNPQPLSDEEVATP